MFAHEINGSHEPLGDRDCPIGQLVAASHNFIGSDGVAAVLPELIAHRAALARDKQIAAERNALGWQRRAPPCDLSKA